MAIPRQYAQYGYQFRADGINPQPVQMFGDNYSPFGEGNPNMPTRRIAIPRYRKDQLRASDRPHA
jgi:hypothetical protein